jgi:hypothetical protein
MRERRDECNRIPYKYKTIRTKPEQYAGNKEDWENPIAAQDHPKPAMPKVKYQDHGERACHRNKKISESTIWQDRGKHKLANKPNTTQSFRNYFGLPIWSHQLLFD